MFSQFNVNTAWQPEEPTEQDQQRRRKTKSPEVRAKEQRRLYALELNLNADIPSSSLLEHVATSNFFHHYVCEEPSFYRLELGSLSTIIDNALHRQQLSEIIVALGILTLPDRSSSSVLAARYWYTKALRQTNLVLADATAAKSDEALMAVVLLGLYETTPDESHSSASWSAHLDGARRLLQLQSIEQLSQRPSYKTFSLLRLQIILHCLMSKEAVPQDLMDLSSQLSIYQSPEEQAAGRLLSLVARLCTLSASNWTDNESNTNTRDRVIEQAETLDDDLAQWSTDLQVVAFDAYAVRPEVTPTSSRALRNVFFIYATLFSAEVWNLYRTARVSLNGLILHYRMGGGQHPPSASGSQGKGKSRQDRRPTRSRTRTPPDPRVDTIDVLRRDIGDTIPYLLGMHRSHEHDRNLDLGALPLHARTLVIHTLYFLIQTGDADEPKTVWSRGLLEEMQRDADVDQGAIWMNNSQTTEGTQSLVVRPA